jgi:hypothetical protein
MQEMAIEQNNLEILKSEIVALTREISSDREAVLSNLNGLISQIVKIENAEDREAILPVLFKFIKIDLQPTSTELLSISVTNDLILNMVQYGIDKVTESLPNIYEGNHTIVFLWPAEGKIAGVWEKTESGKGDAHQEYGNLAPYALCKAILQMHIYLKNKSIGIAGSQDELTAKIGGRIFQGGGVLKHNEDRVWLVGGASGCQFTREFLSQYLPDHLIRNYERLGGLSDEIFLKLIDQALKIAGEGKDVVFDEPPILRLLGAIVQLGEEQASLPEDQRIPIDWPSMRTLVRERKKVS